MEDAADESVDVAQRPEFSDLVRRQELHVDTDRPGGGRILIVLVHAVIVHRETQIPDLLEADGLARLLFELPIQLDRVFVNLTDAVAHIEKRQQSRGMPRRTRCQFALLDQHDVVAPAFLGKVVERADADDTAADDDNFGLRFHDVNSWSNSVQ